MRGLMWEMSHPQVTYLADEEAPLEAKLLPVYPLTEGLSQYQMRRIVQAAVDEFADAARRSVSRRAARASTS